MSAHNISNKKIAIFGLQHFLMLHQTGKQGTVLRDFQVKTNVHTSCESHDLNMDLVSFDKDFKELCTQLYVVWVLRKRSHWDDSF